MKLLVTCQSLAFDIDFTKDKIKINEGKNINKQKSKLKITKEFRKQLIHTYDKIYIIYKG